jgi:hypothetical protein
MSAIQAFRRETTWRLRSQRDGDDPDEIVDRVQQKTGPPRDQVEQRVQRVMQGS